MEKLCIFCKHFKWTKESMWGMGSTQTGPMFEGGWAECSEKQFKNLDAPEDEADFRKIILRGEKCPKFSPVG